MIMKKLITYLSILTVAFGVTYLAAQSPIPADSPVVKPATEERTYPHEWILRFSARANTPPTAENPAPSDGILRVVLAPYNAATGEVATDLNYTISANIWEASAYDEDIAAAMAAVYKAIPKIRAFLQSKRDAAESAAAKRAGAEAEEE